MFVLNGENINLVEYFKAKYKISLHPQQPLLEVTSYGKTFFLPTELCRKNISNKLLDQDPVLAKQINKKRIKSPTVKIEGIK